MGDAAAACSWKLPDGCDGGAPSFANQVNGIITERCLLCHKPGGLSADKPLTTYDQIYGRRGAVLNQVYACLMPTLGAPPLTEDEGKALIAWLVCGAPNN